MLDKALEQDEPASAIHRIQALVFRAGWQSHWAIKLLPEGCWNEMRQTALGDDEGSTLITERQRADDLEHTLQ